MKTGKHRYKYLKQVNGRSRVGIVVIEAQLSSINEVEDRCEWKTYKESYSDFKELDILKLWKESALQTAKDVINYYDLIHPIKVIIHDISGLYVDTIPSHVGAAVIIGLFDICEKPLNKEDIIILDEFITREGSFNNIPDFKKLPISENNRVITKKELVKILKDEVNISEEDLFLLISKITELGLFSSLFFDVLEKREEDRENLRKLLGSFPKSNLRELILFNEDKVKIEIPLDLAKEVHNQKREFKIEETMDDKENTSFFKRFFRK